MGCERDEEVCAANRTYYECGLWNAERECEEMSGAGLDSQELWDSTCQYTCGVFRLGAWKIRS